MEATRGERDGRGQAAHPRSDDYDSPFHRHGGPPNAY
jgi:hypothetical protein